MFGSGRMVETVRSVGDPRLLSVCVKIGWNLIDMRVGRDNVSFVSGHTRAVQWRRRRARPWRRSSFSRKGENDYDLPIRKITMVLRFFRLMGRLMRLS